MRILFCLNSLGGFGGIERVTIVKANALAEIEGNNVAICYTDRGGYPNTIHPLSTKVKAYDLNTPYWGFTSASKILKGIIPMTFRTRKALIDIIGEFKPDVIITTGSYEKYALATISSRGKNNVRKFIKIREYHFNSNYRRFLGSSLTHNIVASITEFFERHILSRCYDKSYLLTRADFQINFKGSERFDYMYNPTSFSTLDSPSYTNRHKVILAVGRLSEQKNFEVLISIWSKIYHQAPGWKLKIIGDGNLRAKLIRLASECGVEESVQLPGKSYDVASEMAKASIYAMTSKYEGFPLVLLEAQSMGLPIISFDTPYGPSEIVRHNVDGFIIDYNNHQQYQEKLLSLISDHDLRLKMSQKAVMHSKDFNIKKIVSQWMANYETLLAKK